MTGKLDLQRELQAQSMADGADSLELIPILEKLATLCHHAGEYYEAQSYYERCLDIANKVFRSARARELTITTHRHLALLHRVQSAFDKAEPHYKQAFKLSAEHFGEQHTATALARNYLAGLYFARESYDESEALLHQSLRVYQEVLGKDHEVTGLTLYALALVTRRSCAPPPAGAELAPIISGISKDYYERSLSLLPMDLTTLSMQSTHERFLAIIHLSQVRFAEARYDEAEELFRNSFFIELEDVWPSHPLVADSYQLLGDLYRSVSAGASEVLYRQALAVRKEVYGDEHPKLGSSAYSLGLLLADSHRYEEAEPLLSLACAIHRQTAFPPVLANSLNAHAKVLAAMGQTRRVSELQAEADSILRRHGHS